VPPSLDGLPMARKDLFHRCDHTRGALFATRGCPNRCDFCAIGAMYGSARRRPVEEVAAEFASSAGRVIIFWDDNLAGDLAYAKDLFKAIAPHRKWWSSQVSLHAGMDDEFLDEAARSGCKHLFLGLESVSQPSMVGASKGFNRVEEYAAVVRIHAHGMAVQAGIVFSFDQDPPTIFEETLAFLEDAGVQNATFNILTPYPGTPLFRRLEAEGRILTRDWRQYNGRNAVVFPPALMSPKELLAGFRRANARFYSLPSIARRLSRARQQLWWTLPLNLAYGLRWRMVG
ncbi:MAG TPA: radical SAM protein, partial [Holophaga sp.]|nr:radical SAM protein [Holophaga sp.]